MKVAALTDINQIRINEIPDPEIEKPTDVLLKIELVGVCGSDVHYYETGRIGSQIAEFPFIVGHECSATVLDTGSDVTRVKKGDRITVDPAMPCFKCDQCKQDRENTCRKLRFLGSPGQSNGCLCEFVVMPQSSLFPIPDSMSLEQAALAEPATIGLYSVKQANLSPASRIAILGAGPIGLSCMLAARALNTEKCYMTEKIEPRCQTAISAGADWVGNPLKQDIVAEILKLEPLGLDAVLECAGQQETLDQAVKILKPGGRLVLVGIPREEKISFIIDEIRRKELKIINIRRQNNCTQQCLDLIAQGKISPEFMITHRFKLEQTKKAFDLVAKYADGVVKAVIHIGAKL
jgi:L-iditol 2-dehydrogenase